LPRVLLLAALLAFTALAAENKGPATVEQSDEILRIVATLYLDKDSVVKAVGLDPGLQLIVVEVKFSPRGENKVPLWLDDFTLLSHKDGQRSTPLTPTQIAGRAFGSGAWATGPTGAEAVTAAAISAAIIPRDS